MTLHVCFALSGPCFALSGPVLRLSFHMDAHMDTFLGASLPETVKIILPAASSQCLFTDMAPNAPLPTHAFST